MLHKHHSPQRPTSLIDFVCLCILLQSTLFDSALHVVPGSAKVQLNVGIERWREGKLQLASRHLSTAERIDPEYCQVHYWFARVHLDAKDYDVRVAGEPNSGHCRHRADPHLPVTTSAQRATARFQQALSCKELDHHKYAQEVRGYWWCLASTCTCNGH